MTHLPLHAPNCPAVGNFNSARSIETVFGFIRANCEAFSKRSRGLNDNLFDAVFLGLGLGVIV